MPQCLPLQQTTTDYNLQEDDYDTEVTTIQNILYNSAFPIHNENTQPTPDVTREQTTTRHTYSPI